MWDPAMWDPATGRAKFQRSVQCPLAAGAGHEQRVLSMAVARVEGQDSLFMGSMD
jgi:hypothetical protein